MISLMSAKVAQKNLYLVSALRMFGNPLFLNTLVFLVVALILRPKLLQLTTRSRGLAWKSQTL